MTNNSTDVSKWHLRKGLQNFKPNKSFIDISLANFTELNYLNGATSKDDHIIKVNMLKDFEKPGEVKLWANFGRLKPQGRATSSEIVDLAKLDPSKGIMDVDATNVNDALSLSGKVKLTSNSDDGYLASKAKEVINKVLDPFTLDIRIHKLTAVLDRKKKGDKLDPEYDSDGKVIEDFSEFDEAPNPYRINVKLEDSLLSFRVKTNDTAEKDRSYYEDRLGFHCTKNASAATYSCYQDFATWSDFQSKFLNKLCAITGSDPSESGVLAKLLDSTFRFVASNLVYYTTKKIIDNYFPEIEKDIDKQINKMDGGLPSLVDSFAKSRFEISNKMNELSKTIPKDIVQ
ncbi:MAG: hypothetical protein HQK51_02130 [Oligoflexia bacterium]|nr:hypothetical protein [Oligoflexia bacterium]